MTKWKWCVLLFCSLLLPKVLRHLIPAFINVSIIGPNGSNLWGLEAACTVLKFPLRALDMADLSGCAVCPDTAVCVFVGCCSHDTTSNYALTSSTASVQFHSCGEGDILIGSLSALSPQSSQLGGSKYCCGRWGTGSPGSWVNHRAESGQHTNSLLLTGGDAVIKLKMYRVFWSWFISDSREISEHVPTLSQ